MCWSISFESYWRNFFGEFYSRNDFNTLLKKVKLKIISEQFSLWLENAMPAFIKRIIFRLHSCSLLIYTLWMQLCKSTNAIAFYILITHRWMPMESQTAQSANSQGMKSVYDKINTTSNNGINKNSNEKIINTSINSRNIIQNALYIQSSISKCDAYTIE